jgi:CBS domain containing-hemolysin-like protein
VTDPSSSNLHFWLGFAVAALLIYRAGIATLLAAFHSLSSVQRRRRLEEESIVDPLLAGLMARPHILRMSLGLWSQLLLALLLLFIWPFHGILPGGAWALAASALAYLWALDLALPTLLTCRNPAAWIVRLFPIYAPFHRILVPLVAPISKIFERQRQEQDMARDADDEDATEDAVTALLEEGEAEGILEETDSALIRNVVSFGDTVVREVMTPRTVLVALSVDVSASEAWSAFRKSRHSRIPLFEGGIDKVVGVLLLKDLLQHSESQDMDLHSLMKPAQFVPESKPIEELLRDLQRVRAQMAIVVDEFGAVSGLVTIEDLLEEVFGEIRDEHEGSVDLVEQEPGVFIVSGKVHVEDLEQRMGLSFERNGFDTVAGLVMARLGCVPEAGDQVAVEGAMLTVMRMKGPRILQVRVGRMDGAEG